MALTFFDQALLWRKMVWTYYPALWSTAEAETPAPEFLRTLFPDQSSFTDFLNAQSARVLLPVAPGYENLILLSLLLNGRIWVDGNGTAAVAESYLAIANALKRVSTGAQGIGQVIEEWTEIVPTGFVTLLARDDQLPALVPAP